MKGTYRIIAAAAVCVAVTAVSVQKGSGDSGKKNPRDEALEFLLEASTENCPVCVENLHKKAFKLLNDYYKPGLTLEFTGSARLMKEKKGVYGELFQATKDDGTGKKPGGIRIAFFFHTQRHHHAGVKKEDYSDNRHDATYGARKEGRDRFFTGKLTVIGYPYGDGKTFIYLKKRKVVQVQCLISELTKVPR